MENARPQMLKKHLSQWEKVAKCNFKSKAQLHEKCFFLMKWTVFLQCRRQIFMSLSFFAEQVILELNPYVLLGTFSSTKGCCWVLIWPQLFLVFQQMEWFLVTNLILTHILGKCFEFFSKLNNAPWTNSLPLRYVRDETSTKLDCYKNVSDKYFFPFFLHNLLINLSPVQNY